MDEPKSHLNDGRYRPKSEIKKQVQIRLPQWLIELSIEYNGNRSKLIEDALIYYFEHHENT